ncbi:MAG: PD40 domain-containing protein [Armatimonadetes bacterium]|nr:PD40 domain-containing protein [Armatimonadota bacterium]
MNLTRVVSTLLPATMLGALIMAAPAQTTMRASVGHSGAEAQGASPQAVISTGTGQYVVFTSAAPNLVPGGTSHIQVFRRDLNSNTTLLVSVDAGGAEANGDCFNPRVSPDGRFVSFSSDATNLSPEGDGNLSRDVFRRDILLGTTIRVSVANNEAEGNSTSDSSAISADGNLVAFRSNATNLVSLAPSAYSQVFLRNISAGTTVLVSRSTSGGYGDDESGYFQPQITPNGRYVAFTSKAGNMVSGDTNGNWDVYRRDMNNGGKMVRVSLPTNGAQYFGISHTSAMSDDGRYVAFVSLNAFNIVDTNGVVDVFLRDTSKNTLTRISNSAAGGFANGPSGDSGGWGVRISGDGTKVVFESAASDLVSGDGNGVVDVFLRNRSNNTTSLVSVSALGGSADGASISPSISANGFVSFVSDASNLVMDDTLGFTDVFRRGTY